MTTPGERLFTWLLRFYPREFHERYRDDLLAFFRQERRHPKYGTGLPRPMRFWSATMRDLIRSVWSERQHQRREAARSPMPRRPPLISRVSQDFKFAWRGLWAAPGVTLCALAVLTLGIGAGTAVFSVVDAVALRGLPFHSADRLVTIAEMELGSGRATTVAPQNYGEWQTRQNVFATMGASAGAGTFALRDEPGTSLRTIRITGSLFGVLQVQPALGRAFSAAEEDGKGAPVAIISDRLWRGRFNADPDMVGRTITSVQAGELRVVGVMPPGFSYPLPTAVSGPVDVWLPYGSAEITAERGDVRNYPLTVVARLKPDVTVDEAQARMTKVRDELAVLYPSWFTDYGVLVRRMQDAIVGASVRSWMLLLLGAVAVVVLLACLNGANLLVARAVVRAPELAVRGALGASRRDLARLLFVESLLLSVLGIAGGMALAFWGVDILRATLPTSVPRLAMVALDMRVLIVSALAAFTSAVIFGTIPALQASRPDIVATLRLGSRSHSGSGATRRLRAILVIAEVALAVVLLAGSALFLSSFIRVTSVDLGFDPRHVVTIMGATMSSADIIPATTPEKQAAVTSGQSRVLQTLEQIQAIPGVVAASATQGGSPLTSSFVRVEVQPADRRSGPFKGQDEPLVRTVGPEYLDVMRSTVVSGRWINATDVNGSTPVVVLTEEAARRYFGSASPLGQGLLMANYERTVIGVIRSMRWRGPESNIAPEVFIPYRQSSHDGAQFILRTDREPETVVPAVLEVIRKAMPGVATGSGGFLERSYANLIAQRKFNMVILSIFGIVAVAIAAIGIYGLMAFVVAQRRREIGVRVALGAVPSGILSMMLGGAMRLIVAGLVPGIVAALLLEQTARAFLFKAEPHDPAVYGAVIVVFLLAGLFAALGPARRATRVDPLVALRQD